MSIDSVKMCSPGRIPGLQEKPGGISGSTLKWIAIVSMLIDHLGLALVARLYITNYFSLDSQGLVTLYKVYFLMRKIGRLAFPIYCFLLVEGFLKTRCRWKYASRLGIFALCSEIPFDLAFSSKWLDFGYQNVFFTLFLGMLSMMGAEWLFEKIQDRVTPQYRFFINAVTAIVFALPAALVAHLMRSDYSYAGIFCIMGLYLFRHRKWEQSAVGAVSFLWEIPASLAFLPIIFYNGKRGMKMKYFFYLFYPLHLLGIYLICRWLGIAATAVI